MSSHRNKSLAALTMTMFGARTKSGKHRSLLDKAVRIVDVGNLMAPPKWLEPMEKVPPLKFTGAPKGPLKPLIFPEDRLIRAYFNRHQWAKFETIDCTDNASVHFVRAYAMRQLELMQKGMTEMQARNAVDDEQRVEERAASEALAKGEKFARLLTPKDDDTWDKDLVSQIQAEEEEHFRRANPFTPSEDKMNWIR